MLKHVPFLRAVFFYSITAFGGPQVALALMQNRFVEKRKDLCAEDLMEFNAFCQLLPGASSTQTIILIAYQKGGTWLAFLTLLVWILPATFLMASLGIVTTQFELTQGLKSLQLLQPMAIGFIASAGLLLFKKAVKNVITLFIFSGAGIVTFIGFKTPWTLPLIIVVAGILTNFSDKRIPHDGPAPSKIKWGGLFIFIFLFISAGFLSELSTRQNWDHRKSFNLFENNYRFGSLVFGGGDVLIPMMYEQYVTRPTSKSVQKSKRDVLKLSSSEFLTGSGFVRTIPGPIFSIASYTGAVAFKDQGVKGQIMGAVIASMGVFLPSFLLVLFFFPLWQMLQKYALFYRSLEGIYASIVGIMMGATFYLLSDIVIQIEYGEHYEFISFPLVFIASTYLLFNHKLAPHWIALSCVCLGVAIHLLN